MPSFTMSWPGHTVTLQNSQTSVATTDGLWHHVAVMVSTNSAMLYVDGCLEATATLAVPFPSSAAHDNYIGKNNCGSFYDGYVDDARIYLGLLTARELVGLVCK